MRNFEDIKLQLQEQDMIVKALSANEKALYRALQFCLKKRQRECVANGNSNK